VTRCDSLYLPIVQAFVPLRAPVDKLEPVRNVRSTLLTGSIQALRTRGMFDAYFKLLPDQHHDNILSMVAGVWIPIELAKVHYETLDRLIPSEVEQLEMGRDVADRIHRTILATVAKAATGAGVTPWMGLSAFPKLWERTFEGGGVEVHKLGPKDARIDLVKLALLDVPYFHRAFRGVLAAGIELFCRKAFVTPMPKRSDLWPFKLQWAG
jgi:hypothetical protein